MPGLTREEKLKMIEKLPQRLQDFLYSEDTGAFLLYLGQKYNLPDEKVRLLSKLVADVVLRITPITSLAQEINSKITSDAQAAMNLAQELNTELLAPAMAPAPSTPTVSVPVPATIPRPVAPPAATPSPAIPPADHYREPIAGPEVVDLRNQPKAGPRPANLELAGPPRAEAPPVVSKVEPPPVFTPKPVAPAKPTPLTPAPPIPKPTTPLTFTRPIEPTAPAQPPKPTPATPLIEAEPHKIPIPTDQPKAGPPMAGKPIISAPKPIDSYREPIETQSPPSVPSQPTPSPKPQFIIRPSGAPPTDLPRNILDLRKDKGEF